MLNRALALRYAPGLAASLLLLTLGKLCAVGLPWFVKQLVDALSARSADLSPIDARWPLALIAGYGLALLGSVAFNELKQVLSARLTLRFIQELSQAALSHLLRLPYPYLVSQKSGIVTRDFERGQRGIQVLAEVLLYSLLPALVELALVFGYLALRHAPWLVGWIAFTVFVHVLIALCIAGRWSVFRERYNRAESHCHQRLNDSLINIESVKLFGNEEHETAEYLAAYRGYRREYVAAMRYCAYYQTTQQLLLVISVVVVLWSGYRDVLAGSLSVGDLVMLNALVLQVYLPLNSLGIYYKEVRQALVDIAALARLREQPAEADAGMDQPLPAAPLSRVEFARVGLDYPGQGGVLHAVSLSLAPGSFTAIVGGSGSGKTTLVKLLTRLIEPTRGAIRWEGRDIRDIDRASLRAAIGVVAQDTTLFNSTVGENIRYGRLDAKPADIEEAARRAHVHAFIAGLPQSYDTEVGERGLKLSGGERQRIVIARALLRRPKILILDEGTAALDTVTEHDLLDGLRAERGLTLLMIAHKLTNIVTADQIIVMDQGTVAGVGRHAELLEGNPVYRGLWEKHHAG